MFKYFGIVLFLTACLAISPCYGDVNSTGQINTSIRHQVLEGLGASNVWSGNGLKNLGNAYPEIYDVIFGDLGLDILRLRNVYQYDDQSYIANSAETILDGRARTGGRPLKVLMSSWSPKKTLKSNNATTGGSGSNATLAKSGGNYVYDAYAQWWYDSIVDYNNRGIRIDYASMQNEPDYDATWDSCRFNPTENASVAGYKQALTALYAKLNTMPASVRPKILSPETATLNTADNYIDEMNDTELSYIYAYDHHLYDFKTFYPDVAIPLMTSFGADYNDKPIMQTEFSKQWTVYEDGNIPPVENSDVSTFNDAKILALFMHNSLAVEGVSSYLYYELTYTSIGLVAITSSSWTINPVYYAFKHYSAFTDPNWQRIEASTDSSNLRISAYISPDNNQISIVIINVSADTNYVLDFNSLGYFEVTDGNIYRTNSSLTEKCSFVGAFDTNTFALTVPKSSFTTIALRGTLFVNCSQVQATGYGLASDLDHNCYVDYNDLAIMADYWLANNCTSPNNCEGSDFIPIDGDVDFADLAHFALQWMQCNNPENPDCTANW